MAWLAQIGLFVMLGLLLSPARIDGTTVVQALVTGLVLTVVARPLSVLVSSLAQPMALRDLAFISWAGLRGAVPIVLATIPLSEGVDGAEDIFDIVFVMVVVYTLLTGPTLPVAARWLGVARRSEPRGLDVEAAPLEKVAADLLQVTIAPGSKMHGVEVGRAAPAAGCVGLAGDPRRRHPRARTSYGPAPRRRPAGGHPAQGARGQAEERLRQVSQNGRLAQWIGDKRRAGRARTDGRASGSLRAGGLAVGRVGLDDHGLDLLLAAATGTSRRPPRRRRGRSGSPWTTCAPLN